MKAFLGGQVVAAGNLFRQVTETIALALLCSHRDIQIRRQFMEDKYSSNNAIRDALRRWKELEVAKSALEALKDAQEFYHDYSHPTRHTIATVTSFSGEGLYFGSAFDEGKIDAYTKEMTGRVNLAGTLVSFVEAVRVNVAKW